MHIHRVFTSTQTFKCIQSLAVYLFSKELIEFSITFQWLLPLVYEHFSAISSQTYSEMETCKQCSLLHSNFVPPTLLTFNQSIHLSYFLLCIFRSIFFLDSPYLPVVLLCFKYSTYAGCFVKGIGNMSIAHAFSLNRKRENHFSTSCNYEFVLCLK